MSFRNFISVGPFGEKRPFWLTLTYLLWLILFMLSHCSHMRSHWIFNSTHTGEDEVIVTAEEQRCNNIFRAVKPMLRSPNDNFGHATIRYWDKQKQCSHVVHISACWGTWRQKWLRKLCPMYLGPWCIINISSTLYPLSHFDLSAGSRVMQNTLVGGWPYVGPVVLQWLGPTETESRTDEY